MMLNPPLTESLNGNTIDGKAIAAWVRARVKDGVDELAKRGHRLRLAVVRVGDDPASEVYVRHKVRASDEVGIDSVECHLSGDISQDELLAEIGSLNEDPEVDAILVQLPLPSHLDGNAAIQAVSPQKDADGFHPDNLGRLFSRFALLEPCTPVGIMVMLRAIGCPIEGQHAVVVGRSVIVGRPVSDMLLRANATVTVCHRHTVDLESHVARADIIIAAAGVPELIRGDWVKEGAVVIDVGINRTSDGKLIGDVEFERAQERASAISPVPGGVGPMTVSLLLWNTLLAATLRLDGYDKALAHARSLFRK